MSSTGSYSSGGMPKNPTFSTLKISAGGTFDLYNTADQTTNYERLRADWSGNVARIYTQFGGSASTRSLSFGIGSTAGVAPTENLIFLQRSASPFVGLTGNVSSSIATLPFVSSGGTFTATAGTQTNFGVTPTINQSGTAGYTALDINPTETATGSGTKLLQRWAVGGTAVAQVDNAGIFAAANIRASSTLALGPSFNSVDVFLNRDAADTPALRRSTNAQTFRVYNTYTDASNYERGALGWSGTTLQVGTFNAGTGSARSITFYTSNSARWSIGATSGHFLADTDNSYDIGASGANRPRSIYVGTNVTILGELLVGGSAQVYAAATEFGLASGVNFTFSSSATDGSSSKDSGFNRKVAGVITLNNGTANTFTGTAFSTGVQTVAQLPAAGTAGAGARSYVSDATQTLTAGIGAVVAGGGANSVPVNSDGTNWRIG